MGKIKIAGIEREGKEVSLARALSLVCFSCSYWVLVIYEYRAIRCWCSTNTLAPTESLVIYEYRVLINPEETTTITLATPRAWLPPIYMYICMYLCSIYVLYMYMYDIERARPPQSVTPPYVYLYICIYVSMYLCIYVYMYICVYVYMYIRIICT